MDYSTTESKRFGLRMFRHRADTVEPGALLDLAVDHRADVIVLRVPADQTATIPRLDRVGIPHLTADTLVYYDSDLIAPSGTLRNPNLTLSECTSDDRDTVAAMVEEVFPGYTNHYASNPFLRTDDVLAGYVEWATGYVGAADEGRTAFLAVDGDEAVAFATVSWTVDGVCEGVLYGVRPTAAGRGVYTDVIRLTREHFRSLGFERMRVSTQIQNMAVQRAWTREGFRISEAFATVHLNTLLAASVIEAAEFDLVIDPGLVDRYAAVSGDANPLHFDAGCAAEQGFGRPPAHGLAAIGAVSEHLGMHTPGPGSVIANEHFSFRRPLYPDVPYRMRIGYPIVRPNGYHRVVVTVTGPEGLHLLGYADVFRR